MLAPTICTNGFTLEMHVQMDTQGNLFNFYNEVGGERKITPVGNIADLQSFKVNCWIS